MRQLFINGAAISILCLFAARGISQTDPTTGRLSFDAISIRPSDPSAEDIIFQHNSERFTAKGITLPFLISAAYGLTGHQLFGVPEELGSARYDITAIVDDSAKEDNSEKYSQTRTKARYTVFQQRLQSLLAVRFQLTIHSDVKEMPVFTLTTGKYPSKLTKSTSDNPAGFMPTITVWGEHNDELRIYDKSMLISTLAADLSTCVGRKVVDKTGLIARYDVTLIWASSDTPGPETTAPSLGVALREQLGLKLTSQEGPVEVYIVDHIEKPSAN